MKYRLKIAYDGSAYAGWQRQDNAMTVQQKLEEALEPVAGTAVRTVGAGRTDTGVHAWGQVAHFRHSGELPLGALSHAVNHGLPRDIRVLAAERMGDDFHALHAARSKLYCYRVLRQRSAAPQASRYAHCLGLPLDLEALSSATDGLLGSHDFSAFALSGGSHTQPCRTILDAGWVLSGRALELRIRGNGFLRGMVRSLVGTLIEVGTGRRSVGDFVRLLEGGERPQAGPTAPARGLALVTVDYDPPF